MKYPGYIFKHEDWNRIDDMDATIYVYKGWFGSMIVRVLLWPPMGGGVFPKSKKRRCFGGLDAAIRTGEKLADEWRKSSRIPGQQMRIP